MNGEKYPTHWTLLNTMDADGNIGSLSAESADRHAEFNADGSLGSWLGMFVFEDGEEPSDLSPYGPVDWSGMREAFEEYLARENETAE